MAHAENTQLIERFQEFYREYYAAAIGELGQQYPTGQKSLYVEWADLYQFDPDLADDVRSQPGQLREYAEEALRRYDLPVDVSLSEAHVRLRGLPDVTEIRQIRADHRGRLIAVQGIVRKATDVRPKITDAAFECQRCGTLTRIPQTSGEFQEPHECQGCERQGPFRINFDQSAFVDAQKIRVQESPEGLRGGETPQSIDVHIEDDVTGKVTAGDHVRVTGILHLDQQGSERERSPVFDVSMEGMAVEIEDEQFEDMDISDADEQRILELAAADDIYDQMVGAIAPSIYGYEDEKLAMILQLFSGVTKHLPDGSRIRGDLHMLLIGDPGTGKCVAGDTRVTLADGSEAPIRELVERNLDDPKPVDDGVWDTVDVDVPSLREDGSIGAQRATKVWKRDAPDRMYHIRTASGRNLEVTPSHPLFVIADGGFEARRADALDVGDAVAIHGSPSTCCRASVSGSPAGPFHEAVPDGGTRPDASLIGVDTIEVLESVEASEEWVYDLEVAGTHNYVSNGVFSHNSQLLQYIRHIAPRSVYTSGKGSSSAGITAAAVRDDFGDGQQWTLEAGALVLADQGIAAIDELDKMRCVTGETLVHLGDGRISRIRELAHEATTNGRVEQLENGRTIRDVDLEAWTMAESGELVRQPVTAIHEYTAPESLQEVRLRTGERITATADHPFFVFDQGERTERPADELEPGDWVYVPRDLQQPVTDGGAASTQPRATGELSNEIGPALGAVLGYLSGDGNIFYNREEGVYGIRFTNAEEALLTHFEQTCRDAFDAEPIRAPSEQRDDGVGTVRLHGKEYAHRVLDAGMNLETYDSKAFPGAVSRATQETKAAFVRAVADSEGNVDTATGNVKIFSSSYELLLGLKSTLIEFGISTQLQTRNRTDKLDVHILAITDADSLKRFERRIGFTLERKQHALTIVCDEVAGDRTILDVIPDVGHVLSDIRDSLRLHQSECGIGPATYCDFECGRANVSIRIAEQILEAFDARKRQAAQDSEVLASAVTWDELSTLTERYHVSQRELAAGTTFSQQRVSKLWGESEELRRTVQHRLSDVVSTVAVTSLSPMRECVQGDVKWRRVEEVARVAPETDDDHIPLLRSDIAELLSCPTADAESRAVKILNHEPQTDSWSDLRSELDRHCISFVAVADAVGVADSTISRWVNGVVETDRFPEVREAAMDLIRSRRSEIRSLVTELRERREPRVYDLTVAGTHNFVANGMVVHNSEDRSALHQGLEQQEISISKAGINATLKARCSLLGAANPKYGRFDQYEPIGEQIDLEPALISRFDLIFTVSDEPDAEEDANMADHIIRTNYAGELHTHREEVTDSRHGQDDVDAATDTVEPTIDPDLLRKYIAYAKRNCYPTMTDEAKEQIRDFYVDLRARGADEDAPVPVTARKLEALVRLAEASARVRLSDTVEAEDAERATDIVLACLREIGMDPETGQFDADIVETGTSKSQRDRIRSLKHLISEIEDEFDEGAPIEVVIERAEESGMDPDKAEHEIEQLKQKGEVYEPRTDHLRTT